YWVLFGAGPWWQGIAAGVLLFVLLEGLRLAYLKLRDVEALGGGDAPFAGALAVWLGMPGALDFLLLACLLTIASGIVAKRRTIPFGPGMAAAFVLCLLAPQSISMATLYTSLVGSGG